MTDKKNKNQGFNEDVDPLLGKAKKHSLVAQKTKFKKENVSKASAVVPVPEKEEIITLRFENSEDQFAELTEQFEEDNDIELVIRKNKDDIFIDIPVEHSADFIEFMAENEIKVKEEKEEMEDGKKTEKTENEAVDVKATEKVCDNEKKDTGVNSSVKLKTEVDKIIAEAQISWLKPELASVDTVEAE